MQASRAAATLLILATAALAGCPAGRTPSRDPPRSRPRLPPTARCTVEEHVVPARPPLVVEGESLDYREKSRGERWELGDLTLHLGCRQRVDPTADSPYVNAGYFEVRRRGVLLHAETSPDPSCRRPGLGSPERISGEPCQPAASAEGRRTATLLATGADLTGSGDPHAVVFHEQGGTLGVRAKVYRLGERVSVVGDFVNATFVDLDGDGLPEVRLPLLEFSYWGDFRVQGALPEVLLRVEQGAWVLDARRMRRPPPSDAELARTAAEVGQGLGPYGSRAEWETGRTQGLLVHLLRLIVQGNGGAARRLLTLAWRGTAAARDDFLAAVLGRLATGPWGSRIAALSGSARPERAPPARAR